MAKRPAAALAAAIALAAMTPAPQLHTSRVPLIIDRGVLLVRASVDGSVPMLFVFDPGAGTYLTTYGAKHARAHDEHVLRVGSAAVRETMQTMPGDPQQLFPAHDAHLGMLAGTLGAEFLHVYVVRIDYAKKMLSLAPPDSAAAAAATAIPLRAGRYDVPIIDAAANGVRGTFELDVRAATSMLFTPFAKRLGFVVQRREKRVLKSMRIGPYEQRNVLAWISNATAGKFASPTEAGLIGNDVLSHYTVTLDFPHGMAYLQP